MDWNLFVEIITFLAIAMSAIVAYFSFKETSKEAIKQHSLSLYERYTARYSHIMEIMPNEYYLSHPAKVSPQILEDINSTIRLYIDLCSEELFLHDNHYVNDVVWDEWESGVLGAFENPFVIEFWAQNKEEYSKDYRDFSSFINKKMNKTDEINSLNNDIMEKNTSWTMKCPKCKNKISVTVEPFKETIICPECKTKLKVVKKLQFMAQASNPDLPDKSCYSYDLQIVKE